MARAARPDPDSPEQARSSRRWVVPAVIVAAALALIGGVLWGQQGTAEPEAAPRSSVEEAAGAEQQPETAEQPGAVEQPDEVAVPDLSEEESRDPEDLLAEGPVDAPVALVMFTDYQCPFCAQWSHETLPELREYVDRGELRIEYRDVNVYGEDSERAARASLAAAMQGEHQEYHERLFADGEIRSSVQLSEQALIDLADEVGLDPEQFAADLNSEEVAATIDANAQQGVEMGAFSTPAFIIGGTPTVGAQPTEVFTDTVDEALAGGER